MPTGSAMSRASPMASTVRISVVGMRSMTRPKAGARWKNELPKLPVTARPKKRPNCTSSGSCRPSACRSTARSDSGASGIMRATGSPLACRMANVTSETPTHTTTSRTIRRTTNLVTTRPLTPRGSALRLGVEEPEPLVAAGRVLDALVDGQRVVLREQVDGRRLLADQVLDLRVDAPAPRLVHHRPRLVDHLVEPFHARVVLADPAAGLG